MAIGIDDLDDDFGQDFQSQSVSTNSFTEETTDNDLDEFLVDFLKTRGIDDISKIQFEDDNGNIEERDWNLLSKEEKINILNTPLDINSDDNSLTDEEIQLLDSIRRSNLTPSQYITRLLELNVSDSGPVYKIDDLSDDELYLLDLESRVGEMSDEMAAQALSSAKQNEELFNKQVEGIRKEYKEREDYELQLRSAEIEQYQQEAYNLFQDTIILSIDEFDSIGNLDLNFDNLDKETLALFMLSRDEAGNNYLWQALLDPDTLVKAAWFILNGEEALNNISDYFVNLIKLVSENQYKKGFEEGKNGKASSRPLVVINSKKDNPHRQIKSIDDLDED